jgi:DNA-directed RNA polymerase specialized sigma24 family protein
MDKQDEVWDVIYSVARQIASRSGRIHRGLVTTDDMYQHLSLWALEHWHKIEQWQQEESLKYKLRKTFFNEAQKYVAKERQRTSRSPMSDTFYYSHEVLHELLRDVWTHEGWSDTPDLSNEFVTRSTKPSEELLKMRYHAGGMELGAMAETYGTTEEAMRKRVKRALTKLQDRLGGEQPVWNRRKRSNAEAREEVRNND